ncbi:MAG: ABC transporter permease [Candidatus Methanoperedens sp.]|nr:ABC transporter permease [Candidatus Methanoperedens sp.]MCZ7369211.1 ABC transporter permease [Candidatus Methanoperedens sp.]
MEKNFIKGISFLRNGIQRSLIIVIFLALWEILPDAGIVDRAFLPPVSEVVAALIKMLSSGILIEHILISLQRAFLGFALAVLVAIPLGILMGWYKLFERFVDPLIQAFRNTSTLALYPVFILFLGIGEASKVALLFQASLWPILINTISGVKNVDPLLIKSARSMAVSNVFIFRKVVLPSSIPSIASGIRMSASISLVVLVAAEMIGAKSGLGFLIINSQYNFMIPEMYAAIVTLVVLGLALNYALVWLEKKATGWKEEINI